MSKMEYLKNLPVAVLGGGAVGKTCAADIKLAGREVRLYDVMPFAEKSLKDLDKTGILFDGIQRNRDCFERSGRAFIDVVTSDIEKAIKGAGHIVVSCGSWGHEAMFRAMIPYLEDGQVVNVFADNFGCLLLRRLFCMAFTAHFKHTWCRCLNFKYLIMFRSSFGNKLIFHFFSLCLNNLL